MKSEAEIALEVTLEMVIEMCDRDKDLAEELPGAFVRMVRNVAQKGLDSAKNARKMCSSGCTVK